MESIVQFIVDAIAGFGYIGIFLLMFLESTFFPFPSEVVMIPAGYLAYKGEMNVYIVIACGIGGSIGGALFNYYLAAWIGRPLILKYGKYVLVSEDTFLKCERFFKTHGSISTFSGRLIPGIRQLISLPAGLAHMQMGKFILYTSLGAGIWMVTLVLLGYFIGHNQALLEEYLQQITIGLLLAIVGLIAWYSYRFKRKA